MRHLPMNTNTQAPAQRLSVTVNHWQNARELQVETDKVGLQVTVPRCSHCSTCQSRVRQFTETLERKETLHQWKFEGNAYWLFLPLQGGKDPVRYLGAALEANIARC